MRRRQTTADQFRSLTSSRLAGQGINSSVCPAVSNTRSMPRCPPNRPRKGREQQARLDQGTKRSSRLAGRDIHTPGYLGAFNTPWTPCSIRASNMRHQKQANGQDGTNHTSTPSPQRRNLLLTPWKSYRPAMCKAMVQENRLGAMLDAAAVQCDELMCQLVLVQQMDYGA